MLKWGVSAYSMLPPIANVFASSNELVKPRVVKLAEPLGTSRSGWT